MPPVANAGADVVVDIEAECTTASYVYTCAPCASVAAKLDGSATTDPNGDRLSYAWSESTQTLTFDTPTAGLTYAHTPSFSATFNVERSMSWVVDLEVEDCMEVSTDQVNLTVTCIGVLP
jgi:hypothetical protein